MTDSLLHIHDLIYSYPSGEPAARGIEFSLMADEKHGIIGPNGAGKSTLLQLVTGLLTPDRGSVRVGDMIMNRKNRQNIRRKLGLLFQNSDDQLFSLTVRDDVAFGPLNLGLTPDQAAEKTEQALKAAGIAHLAERAPHTLSGGEKKSAALASLLSMDPEILLLDEPTAGLDPRSRRELIGVLGELSHSMIVVSHDLDFIWDTCPRVSLLHEGRIALTGDTRTLLQDRELLEHYGMELPLQFQQCERCGAVKKLNTGTIS
ncbi:MAG: ABC transporter ATP-binding protein [Spirochaetales bacterium]|nr:ABC transporter ATP-binding protein [Spirochaetales bacterium]